MTTTHPPLRFTLDPLRAGGDDDTTPEGTNPLPVEAYLAVCKDMLDDESTRPLAAYIQGQAQILHAVALLDADAADGRWATECVERLEARVTSALTKMKAAADCMDQSYC